VSVCFDEKFSLNLERPQKKNCKKRKLLRTIPPIPPIPPMPPMPDEPYRGGLP